jgi:zinc transport system substrate-binding protein
MATVSDAQIYFRIGVPFEESWLKRIESAQPNLRIVDTRKGIKLRSMESFVEIGERVRGSEHAHESERRHGHDHRGQDPHIWLSPALVKIQAGTIAEALTELEPQNQELFVGNLQQFQHDLENLSSELRNILSRRGTRSFLVFHPAWGYFADEFDLVQIPIEIEGKEPTTGELAGIIKLAREKQLRTVFVQPQFSMRAAKTIAASLDGAVVPIDPLDEDYLSNMTQIAVSLMEGTKDTGASHE